MIKILKTILLRMLLLILSFCLISAAGVYSVMWVICNGPSQTARDIFVSTILETGQMKFLASWYFGDEEILAITNRNGMGQSDEEVDTGLIAVPTLGSVATDAEEAFDIDGVEVVELPGRAYLAKLMIINDPSRVKVATIYPWSSMEREKSGRTLEQMVTDGDYLGGVNGGEYMSDGNWGGRPLGLVVSDGQIQYNDPKRGDVMVGMNEDHILVIKEIGNMNAKAVENMVAEERIRDAVSFKDEQASNSNHFTKLIINNEAREMNGNGSGANPRTAIGQRADGTILLLVTDGRGAGGHLGATAADLVAIMQEYGAVNAANLDGGSSSAMYYDGAYEMTSVTLYYSTSSWRLPTAFVVEKRD